MDGPHDSTAWQIDPDFVRRLARRVLRDVHEAEDLAQDVWLAWLHRPPAPGSAPRRWIAGVVRNLAAERHRSRGRRSRAEAAGAAPEEPLQPQAQVARAALREELASAVDALREPYRESVRLHFYEDLDARQIARRLGVPLETVRTRLKRALAQLTAELDRRARGDRQRWLEGLALLLPGSTAPRARRLRAARPAHPAAAAAVLAFFGALLWWSSPRPARAAAARHADGSPALAHLDTPRGPAARAPLAPLAAEEPAREERAGLGVTLRGRVLDAAGTPVAGARVGVWLATAPERAGATLPAPQRETRADGAGSFAFTGLPRRFFAYAEAGREVGQEVLVAELAAEEALADVTLRVAPPRTISGRVVDEDGTPVAGAEVVLSGGSAGPTSKLPGELAGLTYVEQIGCRTRSSHDGSFRMEGLTDHHSMLHAHKTGFVAREQLVNDGDQETELRLERGRGLRVRVRDEHGAALAGASVEVLAGRLGSERRATDAGGYVELGPFAEGSELALRIEAPGRAPVVRGWLALAALPDELVLALPAPRTVSVRVLDARGVPVAHPLLAVLAPLGEPRAVPESVRRAGARVLGRVLEGPGDAHGRWTAAGLPQEPLALEVLERESRAPLARVELSAHAREVELVLGAGDAPVTGELDDACTGLPLGPAQRAAVWAFERGGAWRARVARADERGRFTLPLPADGDWIACATADGRTPRWLGRVGAPEPLALALFPARGARLRFTDRNGRPLPGGSVRLADEAGEPVLVRAQERRWSSEARLGPDGTVRLAGLPDRTVLVTCYPSGARAAFTRRLEPWEMSDHEALLVVLPELDLAAARARVELEVLATAAGAPIEFRGDARLRVLDRDGRTTHALAFSAREDGCLLERDKRWLDLRLDAHGVPARLLDGPGPDDDWSPRARLPGFDGRRARFPLELAPGIYEVECEVGGRTLRQGFEAPSDGSTVRVRIVLGSG